MSEQIAKILRRKLDELTGYGGIDPETRYNSYKEVLQFYVLNFIYHHREYSKWIMYGGSALRIIHKLDRMSVDLDFEVSKPITKKFLLKLKAELDRYFKSNYGVGTDFLTTKITTGRGLLLKFHIGEELSSGHVSKQVHVKIDLNHFVAPKIVTERRPINSDQMSFVVLTYNMSALMASKLAAIFLRGKRGVGHVIYEEKGRDIYDLLWYMNKKVVPDLDYLHAKHVKEAEDLRTLFDKLTVKMNRVSDENLKHDLFPLFVDRGYIANWLRDWRETFLHLLGSYRIRTVTNLMKKGGVALTHDSSKGVLGFEFQYNTEDEGVFLVRYRISDYWVDFQEGGLTIPIDENIVLHMSDEVKANTGKMAMKQKQYATLFHKKTKKYLKKTSRIVLGDNITTKLIRMTADNLNREEEILLTKPVLISCELDDLLK